MTDGLRADPPQGTDLEADPTVGLSESAPDGEAFPYGVMKNDADALGWLRIAVSDMECECADDHAAVLGRLLERIGRATRAGKRYFAVLDAGNIADDSELVAALADLDSFTVESANSGLCAVPEGDTPPGETAQAGDDRVVSSAGERP